MDPGVDILPVDPCVDIFNRLNHASLILPAICLYLYHAIKATNNAREKELTDLDFKLHDIPNRHKGQHFHEE